MKKQRSIRFEDDDEELFTLASELENEDSVSAWIRRSLRNRAAEIINEHKDREK